ncbi:tubulin binding cofactor C-domain-containing protein [Zopfochytrium polystomum]|nr:tubulin binding cofactor C-domain-containing protein [Zopfochytrium polystomum]
MESTSNQPAQDIKKAAEEFFVAFQREVAAIHDRITELNDQRDGIADIKRLVTDLDKRVTDAGSLYLPPYDQRQCAIQLQALNEQLSKAAKPRAKFSFKSSKAAKTSLAASVTVAPPSAWTLNDKATHYEVPSPSEANEVRDAYIFNLTDSIVDLRRIPLAAVHLQNLDKCIVILGAISASVMVEGCCSSVIVVGCRQFRMHASTGMALFLHVPSSPIIEDCSGCIFSPYAAASWAVIPGMAGPSRAETFASSLKKAGLNGATSRWGDVEDFNWLRRGQSSPNWRKMDDWRGAQPFNVNGNLESGGPLSPPLVRILLDDDGFLCSRDTVKAQ